MRGFTVVGMLAVAGLTTGCAYPRMGAGPFMPPPRQAVIAMPAPPSPVGRWDNVMMLEPGTPVRVLRMDGFRADGRFHSASPTVLRVEAGGAVADVAYADVARVDRLAHFGGDAKSEMARGAAVGMGAVGVLGLIVGHMPPPRLWAAGAITGGYYGAQTQMHAAGPGTIYLAPMPGCEGVRQGAAGCAGVREGAPTPPAAPPSGPPALHDAQARSWPAAPSAPAAARPARR
jgi:hypothetical protein